ncbi:hypothetical protein AAG906_013189 [Vitis piasezkii]
MTTPHGVRLLVILHLDSDPLQVKRINILLAIWTANGRIGVGAYCAVAIFEDLRFANGTGSCWRKRLPLSNGRLDQTDVSRSALIKILKSSELTSGRGNQNKAILILSVLLGPSAFSSSFLWLQFL